MLAAGGRRVLRHDASVRGQQAQHGVRAVDHDTRDLAGPGPTRHRGHHQPRARGRQVLARIQPAQQVRAGVELLAQRFRRVLESECVEAGALHEVVRKRAERTRDVFGRHGVVHEHGRGVLVQGCAGRLVEFAGVGKPTAALERGQRIRRVAAAAAIDLAGGEVRAVELHLCPEHRGAAVRGGGVVGGVVGRSGRRCFLRG